MQEINEFLRNNDVKPTKYNRIGKTIIINDDYVLKETNRNKEIFNLLKSRNFNYFPKLISNNEKYELTEYIKEEDIPLDTKIQDLIDLVALLHNKTTYFKEKNTNEIENLYEDINNNILHLESYYDDIMTTIESHVFMSPWEYTLARNISLVKYSLNISKEYLEKWHDTLNNTNKIRKVVIHNNLDIDHFLKNDNSYLISWDKSKIDIPIFDLYKLNNKINKYINFDNLITRYTKNYKLLDYEEYLLYSLCTLPDKLVFNDTLYNNTRNITFMIDKLKSVNDHLEEQKKRTEQSTKK